MDNSIQLLLSSLFEKLQVNVQYAALTTSVGNNWKNLNYTPDFNRFYFIQSGDGWLKIGNREYYPKPGQLFIMPAGILQSYSAINDNTFSKYWCHFTASVGSFDLFELIDIPHYIDVKNGDRLINLFSELSTLFFNGGYTASLKLKSIMFEIIAQFLFEAGSEAISFKATNVLENTNLVLEYINNNLSTGITVKDLAALVHLHPNYFIGMFKKITGLSPIEYIQKVRMEKAKEYLISTGMNINEIADAVGLEALYFSRVFKKTYGLSPRNFRENISTF